MAGNPHRARIVPVAVSAALLLVLALAAPATAITYGEPDGTAHPYVGAVIAAPPAGPGPGGVVFTGGKTVVSTGALIAPNVFLTAGHTVAMLQEMGIADVWVCCDPEFTPSSTLIKGTMHPNPGFRMIGSTPNDLAVITLERPVRGLRCYASLCTADLLGALAGSGALSGQAFTTVGYGLQEATVGGGPRTFGPAGTRRVATMGFSALTPANLFTSQNPVFGYGGGNYFDSGAPVFLGSSNVVVAVEVSGDAAARSRSIACRTDTPEARAYLAAFVTLPFLRPAGGRTVAAASTGTAVRIH